MFSEFLGFDFSENLAALNETLVGAIRDVRTDTDTDTAVTVWTADIAPTLKPIGPNEPAAMLQILMSRVTTDLKHLQD